MSRKQTLTYRDFANVVSYGSDLSFSPDGTHLAYSSNASGQFNLWVIDLDAQEQRQLTDYTDKAVRQLSWSPRGDQILYTADTQGNEKHQLFLINASGGKSTALTNRPEVQYFLAEGASWSPDGRYIAYAGNDREPTAQDVIIREVQTGEDDHAVRDGGVYFAGNWSPDGRKLQVNEMRSTMDYRPVVVNVHSGVSTPLDIADEPGLYFPGPWKRDGSGYWMVSDRGQEFAGLVFVDAETGEQSWVERPDWDVEAVSVSPDGRLLAWVVNEDGYSRLHLRDLATGQEIPLPVFPDGVLKGGLVFSPDSKRIAFQFETATSPASISLLDITTGEVRVLAEAWRSDLSAVRMVEPELVRFGAFDGLQIPAWLFRPHGEGPFPVVYSIHGGPELQERPSYAYRGLYQYLLSLGIGVLATNIRGSAGYGKSYQKLIHCDLGGNDVRDFESAANYLRTVSWVDRERIAVFGGSYGGFAVLTCLSRLPEYWAAGVDIVGPSNLVTMLRSFPPTWTELAKTVFGDVEKDEADLLRRSPITYVDQIVAPLFVIQGANDPRVVQAESDQIVDKLRARGVEVRYDVYADEGHGFTKKENELKAMGDSAEFLAQQLLTDAR